MAGLDKCGCSLDDQNWLGGDAKSRISQWVLSISFIMWNKITSVFSNKNSAPPQQQNINFSYNNNSNSNYQQQQQFIPGGHHQVGGGVQLLKPADKNKKIVAVIVTFCSGSSYDHLFTSVEQKAEEGTQVLVYSCSSTAVQEIYTAFNSESKNQVIKGMVEYIKQLDPDCVVFNWECSSGYSSQSFGEGSKNVFDFVKLMIDRGHMCMFSDFSLKALIAQWDSKVFGPNPFAKVSEYGGNFTIEFEAQKLKDCPSAQLQIIGDMAAEGHCNVQAMGGTIVYGVDAKKADTDMYKMQILTIVTSLKTEPKYECEINGKKGTAGHVLLTYKSGGHLLTSMGHWIELMKIDTSEKVLFEVAAREFGAERAGQMQMEYAGLNTEGQRKEYISRNAVQFVQSQAPCSNMAKKARSKY